MDGSATMQIDSTGDWRMFESAKEFGNAHTSQNRIRLTSEGDQVWQSAYSTFTDDKGTLRLRIDAPPLEGEWSQGIALGAQQNAPVDPRLLGGWFAEKPPSGSSL